MITLMNEDCLPEEGVGEVGTRYYCQKENTMWVVAVDPDSGDTVCTQTGQNRATPQYVKIRAEQ